MAKTNAERQREYRARRHQANEGQGERRLNLWVRAEAALALERLARREGTSKRAVIERLAEEADRQVWEGLEPGSEEWTAYFETGET
mgnify:CR=1 FL=1